MAEGEFKTILVPPTDPIVLNLDGKGIQTAGLSSGVRFDFGGNGVTQNTGWIAPGSGFLVLDRNGSGRVAAQRRGTHRRTPCGCNGVIDNGTELFGNNTPLYDAAGKITGYAANGQAALAALDTNHDGVINSLDAGFANLKIWQDTNQDGICQPGELQTLAQLGITGINVGMTAIDPLSSAAALTGGNQLGATGAFTRADGTTGVAADINLTLNPLSHSFSNAIPVIAAAQALPTLDSGTIYTTVNMTAANDAVFEMWREA